MSAYRGLKARAFFGEPTFLKENARVLGLGFLLTFVSSLGQTFFIGQFKESILAAVPGLTHGSYGQWYMVATLSSAACLSYLGRRIDDLDLRAYTVVVCLGLALACLGMSFANGLVILVLSLFGLRLFGQGLLGHIANTATARYIEKGRGKALSLVNLGHPAGEAVLPIAVVGLLGFIDWRTCWQLSAVVAVACVVPAVLALLRGHGSRHEEWSRTIEERERPGGGDGSRQWTAREVLIDFGFLRIVPALLSLPFIATGLLFHQDVLKASMGWSDAGFARSFIAYSLAQVGSAPVIGGWVDAIGASRMLPFLTLPVAIALFVVAFAEGAFTSTVLMAGMGLSSGIAFSVVGSVLAERYGVRHLGAIRSQLSVMMVISTALSPPLVGAWIDAGQSMRSAIVGFAGFAVVAGVATLGGGEKRTGS